MNLNETLENMEKCVCKQDFNENVCNCFKQALFETSWDSARNLKQPNEAYNEYSKIFAELYDKYFAIRKVIKIINK